MLFTGQAAGWMSFALFIMRGHRVQSCRCRPIASRCCSSSSVDSQIPYKALYGSVGPARLVFHGYDVSGSGGARDDNDRELTDLVRIRLR